MERGKYYYFFFRFRCFRLEPHLIDSDLNCANVLTSGVLFTASSWFVDSTSFATTTTTVKRFVSRRVVFPGEDAICRAPFRYYFSLFCFRFVIFSLFLFFLFFIYLFIYLFIYFFAVALTIMLR